MSLSKREYEEYKVAVDKLVYKYVSRDRSSVVSAITHAVDSGLDKRKVEDKLMGYVDKGLAYKLAEKVRHLELWLKKLQHYNISFMKSL